MRIVGNLLGAALRSRRILLGVAAAAGLALAIAGGGGPPQPEPIAWIAKASAADLVRVQAAADPKAPAAEAPAKGAVDAEISIGEKGVTIRKGGGTRERGKGRLDRDMDEFESFEQFVEQAPWIAALVFGVTALVLFFPLLIIALIVWYKMRTNRLRNETMIKLAERGVVPPAEAIAAVAAPGAALETAPSTAPLYEQAKRVQKRAAWSDLRKGVILGGIGLGLTFYSMIDEGSANGLGLVLLFVGIGYVVLWYFEERRIARPREGGAGPPGGPSA
jgi:hypothetical protein